MSPHLAPKLILSRASGPTGVVQWYALVITTGVLVFILYSVSLAGKRSLRVQAIGLA